MPYVVRGRLREGYGLSPAEYFTLAVREWEIVLGWMVQGLALGYGRLAGAKEGTMILQVESEEEARALVASLPFAPYADFSVAATDRASARKAIASGVR